MPRTPIASLFLLCFYVAYAHALPSPGDPPVARHEASDPRARDAIHYWTPERIASARPRDRTVESDVSPIDSAIGSTVEPVSDAPVSTNNVANDEWDHEWGGVVQRAAGRVYFQMGGGGYVCSGTVVNDAASDRSIILTAAHCVYDESSKEFASNVLFIPNQAGTTGAGTDTNCNNDPLGCWAPTFGVADTDWASRQWPSNIPWDYAYYVVPVTGAHSGPDGIPESLEQAAGSLTISFDPPPMSFTYGLGYSYSHDPNFMYCADPLTVRSDAYNALFLPGCGLSGGASGGPWVQGDAQSHSVMAVNSFGYRGQPGLGAPRLDGHNDGHASSVFALAQCSPDPGNTNGWLWTREMGNDPCPDGTMPPSPAPTPAPPISGYIGCFKDAEDRDLPHFRGDYYGGHSYLECAAMCADFKYFGLQYNYECWCGDSYGKHGAAEDCNCPSTSDQTTGNIGGWRNCVYEHETSTQPPTEQPTSEPTAAPTTAEPTEAPTAPPSVSFTSVCVGGRGNSPGAIELPHNMTVDTIRFTHVNGSLSCGPEMAANFGCSRDNLVALVLTEEVFLDVLLPRSDMSGITQTSHQYAYWYKSDDVTSRQSTNMLWNVGGKLELEAARYLLWHTEDLTGVGESDNRGRACYDIDITPTIDEGTTVAPTMQPTEPPARYYVQRGDSFENVQARPDPDFKAWCRCTNRDNSKGLSICVTGCGNPQSICDSSFGCMAHERTCGRKCSCKPDPEEGAAENAMTSEDCEAQCNAIGMVLPTGAAGIQAAKGTGCNSNRKPLWVAVNAVP